MQFLRNDEANAELAKMRERWNLTLLPEPGVETRSLTTTARINGRKGGAASLRQMKIEPTKRMPASPTKWEKPPHVGPFDYETFVAKIEAILLREPCRITDLATAVGLGHEGFRKRKRQAIERGCWPPPGMVEEWVRSGNATLLALKPV